MSDLVYVSYAHKDVKLVEGIVSALELRGIRCWYMERDLGLTTGTVWEASIEKAFGTARAMLLLFTDWSNKSAYLTHEVATAIASRVPIILLTADDDIHLNPDLERLLSAVQWVRAHTPSEVYSALTQLIGFEAIEPQAPARKNGQPQTVELLFATNRVPSAGSDVYFSDGRAFEITYGKARVVIPANHYPGVIERPGLFSGSKANAIRIESVETFEHDDFIRQIRQRFQPLLLYLHGYCTTFSEAVINLAQVSFDADLTGDFTPILFSWPSKGGYFGYLHDRDSIVLSHHLLGKLIESLRRGIKGISVDIIAHSLGNLLMLEGLMDLKDDSPHVRELIMAAPDVDVDVFCNALPELRQRTTGMTLYASNWDFPLIVSRLVSGKARAGSVPPEGPVQAEHLDSIDVTALEGLGGFNHSKYRTNKLLLDDIRELLKSRRRPPDYRSPSIHGVPGEIKPPCYWKYADKE